MSITKHKLSILDSGIDVPLGINVTCSIPNQINLPLERNGKIDKHSATFIPLCRVPCIVALAIAC